MNDSLDTARPTFPEHVPAARRPGRTAGPDRRRPNAPRVPFALLLAALVVGGMALLLVLNTASAANELSRQKYADADTGVAARVQQLRNEVAASAAPGNLASAAAALGMVPAGNPAFLVVGPHGTVVVRGKPAPASQVAVHVPRAPSTKKPSPKSATKSATKSGTKKSASTPSKTPASTAGSTASPSKTRSSHRSSAPTRTSARRSSTRPTGTTSATKTPPPGGAR